MRDRFHRSLKAAFNGENARPSTLFNAVGQAVGGAFGRASNVARIILICLFLLSSLGSALLFNAHRSAAQTAAESTKQPEDPKAFTDHVIVIATQEFPKLKLKKTDRPLLVGLADSGKLSLENLYRVIKHDTEPGKEDEQIKRFLKSLVEIHPGQEQQPIQAWDDVKNRLRPQIFPSRYLNQTKKAIVCKPVPFSRKLMEGFVIDSENTFQYVTEAHLKSWHTDIDHLANAAYENLSKTSQDLRIVFPMLMAKKRETAKANISPFH